MTACGNERGRRLFERCLLGRKSSDDLVDHASFVLLLSLNSTSCRATAELAVCCCWHSSTTQLKFENVAVVGSIRKSDSWHASKYRYKFLPPSSRQGHSMTFYFMLESSAAVKTHPLSDAASHQTSIFRKCDYDASDDTLYHRENVLRRCRQSLLGAVKTSMNDT